MSELTLSPAEAAEALGISRAKVYQLAREGRIPHLRVGKNVRFPRRQFERWMETEAEQSLRRQARETDGSLRTELAV